MLETNNQNQNLPPFLKKPQYMKAAKRLEIGQLGESKVAEELKNKEQNLSYRYYDMVLPVNPERSRTVEIDIIVIRPNGVFCIEVKSYTGAVYGRAPQEEWQIFRKKYRDTTPNPLRQNLLHVFALSKALGPRFRVFSVVCLANNNDGWIEAHNVVHLNKLEQYLIDFDCFGYRISKQQMEEAKMRLDAFPQSPEIKEEHVQRVEGRRRLVEDDHICPRCGRPLKIEENPQGFYWVCSGEPDCTYRCKIRNLTRYEKQEWAIRELRNQDKNKPPHLPPSI